MHWSCPGLLRWFRALFGDRLLPDLANKHAGKAHADPYDSPFYQRIRRLVAWVCDLAQNRHPGDRAPVRRRCGRVSLCASTVFPASGRLEILVDLKLAEGASLKATEAEVQRLESLLKGKGASTTMWRMSEWLTSLLLAA